VLHKSCQVGDLDIYCVSMPKTKSPQEIEIKLRVLDIAALSLLLKQLRARETCPRTFESNTLYDTPKKDLTRRGQLIRIRIEQPAPKGKSKPSDKNSTAILTYKGPTQESPSPKTTAKRPKTRYKIREELELSLGSGELMTRILSALGLHPVFRYEKFRTTYAIPQIRNVKVEFDETPVGLFLELEGDFAAIDLAARRLGFSHTDYSTESYGALYIADCRRRGIKPSNMLFRPTKKLR